MRARVILLGCSLLGGCLYSEYRVGDGGTAGATGPDAGGVGGRGGGSGGAAAGGAGRGGATAGLAGNGVGGTTGAAGSAGGSSGATGGVGGTTGLAGTGGGAAGRGGTTGAGGSITGTAGTGGAGGRGGTTGVAGTGGVAGRGGTSGTAGTTGTAGRGGTTGTAGRGGTTGTAGTGGGTGGSSGTPAPNWVPSFSIVYQLDLGIGQLAVEAHGILQLNEVGTFFPIQDPMGIAIEGGSAQFRFMAMDPGRLEQPTGTQLPSQLQTPDGTSFTLGGWYRIGANQSGLIQYLISNDGPGAYQGGFVFYLDQTNGGFDLDRAAAYCRIGTMGSTTVFDYNEAQTANQIGADTVAGDRWTHLVCRYDAIQHTLSIFVGGERSIQNPAPKAIRSGPGPFMLGSEQPFSGFAGNMDEVFFTKTALDDQHIKRVYACGIDGSRCRCNGQGYASCGFAAPGCLNLPTRCDLPQ